MITLASVNWGSGPKIPVTLAYEHQRSGADMLYRVQVTIGELTTSTSYFGYPIYLKLLMDGVLCENTTVKEVSPSQWSSAITYTSPWYSVSNKTSGSTVVSFNLYSGYGSTRNETYSYSMVVDPAASLLTVPGGTLGNSLGLTVTKYNASFTHTISYVCGTAKGTVCTQSSDTSVAWNTTNGNTVALASQNTSGQSVTVVFTIITYSGVLRYIHSRRYSSDNRQHRYHQNRRGCCKLLRRQRLCKRLYHLQSYRYGNGRGGYGRISS